MFIRFVVRRLDPDSGRRQGLFQVGKQLRESGSLSEFESERLEAVVEWFDTNLERPSRLSLSAKPNREARAISWFKASALEHIAKMRDYGAILAEHGFLSDQLRTARPGYIVYEDEHQVAAFPFADTPC